MDEKHFNLYAKCYMILVKHYLAQHGKVAICPRVVLKDDEDPEHPMEYRPS